MPLFMGSSFIMDLIHNKWRKPRPRCKAKKRRENCKKIRLLRCYGKPATTTATTSLTAGVSSTAGAVEPNDESTNSDFLLILSSALLSLVNNVLCKVYKNNTLIVNVQDRNGLCAKLILYCTNCQDTIGECFSSPRLDSVSKRQAAFTVNKKAVESAISVGFGHAGLEKFFTNLDMHSMAPRTFQKHFKTIFQETLVLENEVLEQSRNAVWNAYIDAGIDSESDVINICCSYDGTWQKRGHTSMYGAGFVIDLLTGSVIDFEILSKYCYLCSTTAAELGQTSPEYNIWLEGHKSTGNCEVNFHGTSGSMEVTAAEIIWCRSIEKNKMRYTTMLSDGDSRTWRRLNEISPYGSSIEIAKEECVNHVHKRLGKGLRLLAAQHKLGGKKDGALTAEKITSLTKFYRKAIVSNLNDVVFMKKAIMASLHHCCSTDAEPNHSFCPDGKDTWCFYNKCLAIKKKLTSNYHMRLRLNQNVFKSILPLYERLSEESLLDRCSRGATQNANESLHSQVWRKCCKEVFVSKKRIHYAVVHAVMEKNMGFHKSQQLKATIAKENMSSIRQQAYTRMDQVRDKRKVAQDDYRKVKRLKNYTAKRGYRKTKSKDYRSGEH